MNDDDHRCADTCSCIHALCCQIVPCIEKLASYMGLLQKRSILATFFFLIFSWHALTAFLLDFSSLEIEINLIFFCIYPYTLITYIKLLFLIYTSDSHGLSFTSFCLVFAIMMKQYNFFLLFFFYLQTLLKFHCLQHVQNPQLIQVV